MNSRDTDVPFDLSSPIHVAAFVRVVIGEDRQITMLLVDVALACSLVVDPENATVGVGDALHSTVTVNQGPIEDNDFGDYRVSGRDIALEARVHLVGGGSPTSDMDELGVPAIAPAIRNATCATAGMRIRALLVYPRVR